MIIDTIFIAIAVAIIVLYFSLKIRVLWVEKKNVILDSKTNNVYTDYEEASPNARDNESSAMSPVPRDQCSSSGYYSSVRSMNTQVKILAYK